MVVKDTGVKSREAVLEWSCETCGWTTLIPMPGYAGDGYSHYQGETSCGPLIARRHPDFLRARPGEDVEGLYACPTCGENVTRYGRRCDRCEASILEDRLERESGR